LLTAERLRALERGRTSSRDQSDALQRNREFRCRVCISKCPAVTGMITLTARWSGSALLAFEAVKPNSPYLKQPRASGVTSDIAAAHLLLGHDAAKDKDVASDFAALLIDVIERQAEHVQTRQGQGRRRQPGASSAYEIVVVDTHHGAYRCGRLRQRGNEKQQRRSRADESGDDGRRLRSNIRTTSRRRAAFFTMVLNTSCNRTTCSLIP
jgi:hypothetical protein